MAATDDGGPPPQAPGGSNYEAGLFRGPLADDLQGTVVGICHTCARRRGPLDCDAFPGGIPYRVLVGEVDHHQPVPGDGGLQWVAKERTQP